MLVNGKKEAHPHSDIWSGALCIIFMYTGKHAWLDITREKLEDPDGRPGNEHVWNRCVELVRSIFIVFSGIYIWMKRV